MAEHSVVLHCIAQDLVEGGLSWQYYTTHNVLWRNLTNSRRPLKTAGPKRTKKQLWSAYTDYTGWRCITCTLLQCKANYYAVGFAVRWKSTFQYVRMSFCPENVGNWSFSPQTKSELSPKQSRAVSRFSRGPVAGYHRRHFFDPTVSDTITIVHRIEINVFPIRSGIAIVFDPVGWKKCWRRFPATGPLEKRGKQLWINLEESSDSFRGEEDLFQHFRGKSSCERTERYFFNGLQIQLLNNWPNNTRVHALYAPVFFSGRAHTYQACL